MSTKLPFLALADNDERNMIAVLNVLKRESMERRRLMQFLTLEDYRLIMSNQNYSFSRIFTGIIEQFQYAFARCIIKGTCRFITEQYFRIFC